MAGQASLPAKISLRGVARQGDKRSKPMKQKILTLLVVIPLMAFGQEKMPAELNKMLDEMWVFVQKRLHNKPLLETFEKLEDDPTNPVLLDRYNQLTQQQRDRDRQQAEQEREQKRQELNKMLDEMQIFVQKRLHNKPLLEAFEELEGDPTNPVLLDRYNQLAQQQRDRERQKAEQEREQKRQELNKMLDEMWVFVDNRPHNEPLLEAFEELEGDPTNPVLLDRYNQLAQQQRDRDRQKAEQEREQKRQKAEQERQEFEERLTELRLQGEALRAEADRLKRLLDYCDDGSIYFRKTMLGLGEWIEEDEDDGTSTRVEEFDVDNKVINRLMELQAAGWGNKIPAGTVACGEGNHQLFDVIR